jgi:transaldolase
VNALLQLHHAGQSVWLDNIRRDLLTTGSLARYISEYAVSGVTSNPTILQRAITGSADYDDAIRSHLDLGSKRAEDLAFALALEDLGAAADLLRPIFDATRGADGHVSVEVSPELAHHAEGTVTAGRGLFAAADRPNLMIKVPGTRPGLVAVEALIASGIPVNVTLLFSAAQYLQAAESYLRGVERRLDQGLPLPVGSVASVFVSRWDAAADPRLPGELRAKLGIAAVQKTYAAYCRLLASDRWRRLAAGGALPQKVLWASTATKDPSLPDLLPGTAGRRSAGQGGRGVLGVVVCAAGLHPEQGPGPGVGGPIGQKGARHDAAWDDRPWPDGRQPCAPAHPRRPPVRRLRPRQGRRRSARGRGGGAGVLAGGVGGGAAPPTGGLAHGARRGRRLHHRRAGAAAGRR